MRTLRLSQVSLGALALVAASWTVADSAPGDPAARGLDVFVHVPDRVVPGGTLPVLAEAFGFATATTAAPLPDASIEVSWDPEQLGEGLRVAPPAVLGKTDAAGRIALAIPVPDGDERDLRLLVGVRVGAHARTRTLAVHRTKAGSVTLRVAETRVVPGSTISAWVVATTPSDDPLASAPVEVELLEGGVARHRVAFTTDAAGTGMVRVPIPRTNEPAWSWSLVARALPARGKAAATAAVHLTPREETPGKPNLTAVWDVGSVFAGDRAQFTLRVRDGLEVPVAGAAVRTWIGPRGTTPPKTDGEWEKLATRSTTDTNGEVRSGFDAPKTVVRGVGTELQLVARTNVDGHELSSSARVSVGVPTASVTLTPEGGTLVPGVEQRLFVRVLDGRYAPVADAFSIEADGLTASITTDRHGEAEVVWRVPAEVGARRDVGPCAGGVAASVRVRAVHEIPALGRTDPFELCVAVDRDAVGLLALDRLVARVGEPVHVAVRTRPDDKRGRDGWSVVVRAPTGAQATSRWIDDGAKGADLVIPAAQSGVWSVSVASPSTFAAARILGGAVLVTPKTLPVLAATAAGTSAPGRTVDVDASITDGHGGPLTGTVAAVVIDLHGGGGAHGLDGLDTRKALCGEVGVEPSRCDAMLEGDAKFDAVRRAMLAGRGDKPLAPVFDPGAVAHSAITKTFGEVMRSLEGAVFQATASPDLLRDVRRRGPGGWGFNPELMTLVTAAMTPAPTTPGGEPLALADLMAVDAQVTFDNVARRVTRLKLFRVLSAVRAFRRELTLDLDEPMFKNPNAILRRLVREGKLGEDALLDPWGGTIQFARAGTPPPPFLRVARGFELRAPGPDGRIGTADDVTDPFERVLASGTPYATALGEDRIVDAKDEMEVAEATVHAWEQMFDELTGTVLGGRGRSGGMWGTGLGEGFGAGGLGLRGIGRGTVGIAFGGGAWTAPVRTDANGHVRIPIPLGDVETTWRIALVAVPDGGHPATTHVDVATSLPLSATVDAGARWVEHDEVVALVTVRNRGVTPAHATVAMRAGGVASLVDPRQAKAIVDVPAGASVPLEVRLSAATAGGGELAVDVTAFGFDDDHLTHRWEVLPAGEPTAITQTQWVEHDAELRVAVGPGARLLDSPRLVLERGFEQALRAALEAFDGDALRSPDAAADAVEAAARVRRWAVLREGDGASLAVRAEEIGRGAEARLLGYRQVKATETWASRERASRFATHGELARQQNAPATCPPEEAPLSNRVATLDAEPPPVAGAALACWDAFVSTTLDRLQSADDPIAIARAVLAFAERPNRVATAAHLVDQLRLLTELRPTGAVTLAPYYARSRAARATVFAALLRGAALGSRPGAPRDKLVAWVAVQQDGDGSYGSPSASLAVVRALLADPPTGEGKTTATITTPDGATRTVEVDASARVVIPLNPRTVAVRVAVRGPGLIARFERPVLRLWSAIPDAPASPASIDVRWPAAPVAGKTGVLRIAARHGFSRSMSLDLHVPLPPGVSLSEPVQGIRQVQGALAIRRTLDATLVDTMIEVPLRFSLAGRVTVPEARATFAYEELPRALAPARPLVVR